MDFIVLTVLAIVAIALIIMLLVRRRRGDSTLRHFAVPDNLLESYRDVAVTNEQLIARLEEAIAGIRQVDTQIYELASLALQELEQGDTTKAVEFYQQRAKDSDDKQHQADSYLNIAALAYQNDTELALSSFQKAVELDPSSHFGWNQLGILYLKLDQLDEATVALQKVVGIQGSESAFESLACIYEMQERLDDAIVFYKKALAMSEESGDKIRMATQYGNLGNVCEIKGETDKAIDYLKKSLQIESQLDRKEGMAADYGNLGICYQAKGDFDQAEQHYAKSLALNEQLRRKSEIVLQLGNLGIVFESQGKFDEATAHWNRARVLYLELGDKESADNMQDWIDQAKP